MSQFGGHRLNLRLLLAVFFALLCPLVAGVAFADSALPSGPLLLKGQALLDQSEGVARLTLAGDSADGGWHLDATLLPVAVQSPSQGGGAPVSGQAGKDAGRPAPSGDIRQQLGNDPGAGVISLDGQFSLDEPNGSAITGEATGSIDQSKNGHLQLTDHGRTVALDGSFSIDSSGVLKLDLRHSPTTIPAPQESHTFWFLSRAAGMTAYLLLFVNMVLGLAVGTRSFDGRLAPWFSFDLHQLAALLALGFLALHVLALLGDRTFGFTLAQLLLPIGSPYRPFPTALGIFACYTILLVTATCYVRSAIGQRTWKGIHYCSFAAYVLALGHGILAGSDTGQWWAIALYCGTGLVVVWLAAWHFTEPAKPGRAPQPSGAIDSRV